MKIKKIISVILLILWIYMVFNFSNQKGSGSSNLSKKVSGTIIDILDINNKISQEEKEEKIKTIEPVIRKLAHYAIYILGGILIINCMHVYEIYNKKEIIYSAIIGIVYAISDEIHQLFINGRSGKIEDVIIDTIGILTGITIYLLIRQLINWAKTLKGGV